ncbi:MULTISPECIES: peptidase inhibitor family I36 protein [unclassified Streptomyces]|uniref:peptidase inhibitor family I36 protein n=1 Tax=unclassified Streptomyces TaxID=2593676 RepID=UPI001E3324A6|nr:peptidase inhibitor family I36 protein [Streptomyces sp. MBT42]MCD2462236.1 peptidase inhibitor family I36 protein [Streptomyces sp. MBT42]
MRISRALATALTAGALALLTAPVADARAVPEAALPGAATAPAAVAPAAAPGPDGFLYAWEHPHAGGFHCRWNSANANWAGCRDKVSDVWNNGYPGVAEDVKLYRDTDWNGSWVCLHQGHSLPDLGASGLRFFSPGHGQGELVNDRVGSHLWVSAC